MGLIFCRLNNVFRIIVIRDGNSLMDYNCEVVKLSVNLVFLFEV